jgi:C4-dicarboxylate-specific signal transduction histidine kinase
MNLRRVQSPEFRPSTNTSIGKISVLDPAEVLIQKTDRSGFIENENFKELRRFATDALDWMAKRRLQEREKTRVKKRKLESIAVERAKNKVDAIIEKLPKEKKKKVEEAVIKYERAKERETKILQDEVQLYRTLSTVGTTSATFAHESKNTLGNILESGKTVRRRGQEHLGPNYEKLFKNPVDRIITSAEALANFSTSTLSLLAQEKRRKQRVQIHQSINAIIGLFHYFFLERNVTIEKRYAVASPYLLGSEAALDSIIINLITNSLRAFEESESLNERKIVFITEVEGEELTIRVTDNGPGIQGIKKQDIWLPGYTTTPNGTGLGLTIVKDAVSDLGGKIDVIERGAYGGAEFVIQLPILAS